MIDLHCHLLPGIDDGPKTMAESLELCRIAVTDGITHAVTTPHIHPGRWENTRQSIHEACEQLKAALKAKNNPLQLGYAAEVRLTDQVLQQVTANEIPFYGEVDGYKIMLLEFPHGHIIPGSENLVNWLMKQNIRPIIAHPERNKQLMKSPADLEPFIEAGCWLQVTAGAVTGRFGEPAHQLANKLLNEDKVTVIASDGHNSNARQPALRQAYEQIRQSHGDDRAQTLIVTTPARIAGQQFATLEVA